MEIVSTEFRSGNAAIPLIKISSPGSKASVIIMHGFGGNKEEQLGLSFHISEIGFDTWTIDLSGHGQNSKPLDLDVLEDLNFLIDSLKGNGKVVTIGHSLGGRLSLLSKADFRIGISPALEFEYSDQTISFINNMRKYRVTEKEPDINFKILRVLPLADKNLTDKDLILFGGRDVSEIKHACQRLLEKKKNVMLIPDALHNDIFLLEETFAKIQAFLEVKVR